MKNMCDNCEAELVLEDADYKNGFAWCDKCRDEEQERHISEDMVDEYESPFLPPGKKAGLFSRPPKYVLPKAHWKHFGYE